MRNSKRDIAYVWLIALLFTAIVVLLGARAIATSNVDVDATMDLTRNTAVGGSSEAIGMADDDSADDDATSVITPTDIPSGAAGVLVDDVDEYYTDDYEAEIFKIKYTGTDAAITVASDNGERVIAPGTQNSYVFNVENSSGMTLDYSLNMQSLASIGGFSVDLPIEVKLSDYTGRYIVGSQDTWGSVADLATAQDTGTVGESKYIQYTLEWRWPFEGNDKADTLLGLVASGAKLDKATLTEAGLLAGDAGAEDAALGAGSQDATTSSTSEVSNDALVSADATDVTSGSPITFAIKFDTLAQKDTSGVMGGGLTQTGDKVYITVAILVCSVVAAALLIILIAGKLRDGCNGCEVRGKNDTDVHNAGSEAVHA